MSSSLVKHRTFPLSKLVAATSSVSIRVRLLDLSPLLRTKNSDFYCRAWVVDTDANMEIVFWHVSEIIYAELQRLENRVVVMEGVGIRSKSDGTMGVNFTGSVPPVDPNTRLPPKTHFSSICEVTEDSAYPKVCPKKLPRQMDTKVTSTHMDVTSSPLAVHSPSRSVTTTSGSWTTARQDTRAVGANPRLVRPPELVVFECLACHHIGGSALPSCPMTGNPHPQVCMNCNMLQRPVLDFCPETGKPHP